MALRASSSCTQTAVTNRLSSTKTVADHPHGLVPLPAKPKFEAGSGSLQRTKSRKPVKANATSRDAAVASPNNSLESAVTQTIEEIATTSAEILDSVLLEDGSRTVSRRTSRTNSSKTSRRRALVMCLALGMVRPCASNVMASSNNLGQSSNIDLRRTMSESIRGTASLQVPSSNLMSQVSLATTLKSTNMLGEKEDLQKLTTLQ